MSYSKCRMHSFQYCVSNQRGNAVPMWHISYYWLQPGGMTIWDIIGSSNVAIETLFTPYDKLLISSLAAKQSIVANGSIADLFHRILFIFMIRYCKNKHAWYYIGKYLIIKYQVSSKEFFSNSHPCCSFLQSFTFACGIFIHFTGRLFLNCTHKKINILSPVKVCFLWNDQGHQRLSVESLTCCYF